MSIQSSQVLQTRGAAHDNVLVSFIEATWRRAVRASYRPAGCWSSDGGGRLPWGQGATQRKAFDGEIRTSGDRREECMPIGPRDIDDTRRRCLRVRRPGAIGSVEESGTAGPHVDWQVGQVVRGQSGTAGGWGAPSLRQPSDSSNQRPLVLVWRSWACQVEAWHMHPAPIEDGNRIHARRHSVSRSTRSATLNRTSKRRGLEGLGVGDPAPVSSTGTW